MLGLATLGVKAALAGAPPSVKLETAHGEVRVLNRMAGAPPFTEPEERAFAVEIETGVPAPVCSLAHLRAMKRSGDRLRDRVDLNELDELHGPEST